jgi:hypothetical protein
MAALFLFSFFTVTVFSRIYILFIQIKPQQKAQPFCEGIFLISNIILSVIVLYIHSCKIMLNGCNVPQYPKDPLNNKISSNDHHSIQSFCQTLKIRGHRNIYTGQYQLY